MQSDGKIVTGEKKEDTRTWIPIMLDCNIEDRKNVSQTMGGSKIYLPTVLNDLSSLSIDAKGNAIDGITGVTTGIGDGTLNYFSSTGNHFESNGTRLGELGSNTSHVSKYPLIQDKEVMSIDTWLMLGEKERIGNFWVVNTNGWAYWANYLNTDQATSLLLHAVIFQTETIE